MQTIPTEACCIIFVCIKHLPILKDHFLINNTGHCREVWLNMNLIDNNFIYILNSYNKSQPLIV